MSTEKNPQSWTGRIPVTPEEQTFVSLAKNFLNNGVFSHARNLLIRANRLFPHHTALITSEQSITYSELFSRVVAFSQTLITHGVTSGDRVVVLFENSIEFYQAYFAIWHLGAVAVPLNIFLHDHELKLILHDAQPKAVVASDALMQQVQRVLLLHPLACPPKQSCEGWEQSPALLGSKDLAAAMTNGSHPSTGSGRAHFNSESHIEEKTASTHAETLQHHFENIQKYEPKPGARPEPVEGYERESNTHTDPSADELCVLLYTSGTTGVPKGVMLSSKNILTNALQCNTRFSLMGLADRERFFCVLPLFHVFTQNTCIWLATMTGAAVILVSKVDRKLIMQGLEQKPTLFFGVPTLYGLLCLMRNAPLDSVKIFVSGADMMPDKIRAGFAIVYGRKICSGYGLTEASPVIGVNHENNEQPTNVVGKPLAFVECSIRDEHSKAVPTGTIGTLWVKGDNIMLGYYKAPEATAAVLQDGWLNTGDLASFDTHGILAIRGRSKDLIIHKGFNIYPAEVENILLTHPLVFKAAVIGKADTQTGQIPVAYVAVKSDKPELQDELRKLCTQYLASYKIPRTFICMQDLPLNATGKIDKKKLTLSTTPE